MECTACKTKIPPNRSFAMVYDLPYHMGCHLRLKAERPGQFASAPIEFYSHTTDPRVSGLARIPDSDSCITTFPTGAKRARDNGVLPYDCIPAVVTKRDVLVYAEGLERYGRDNWKKGIPSEELWDHLLSHIHRYREGDRSEDHLAKARFGLACLMYYDENQTAQGVPGGVPGFPVIDEDVNEDEH